MYIIKNNKLTEIVEDTLFNEFWIPIKPIVTRVSYKKQVIELQLHVECDLPKYQSYRWYNKTDNTSFPLLKKDFSTIGDAIFHIKRGKGTVYIGEQII